MTTLSEFLLARIAEDEAFAHADDREPHSRHLTDLTGTYNPDCPTCRGLTLRGQERLAAECEAKRRIVELHKSWPVLVEHPPEFTPPSGDLLDTTYRLTQQIAWLTQEEYRKRFGEEPPTAPVMSLLALPYADHPDYDEAWRP